MRAAGLESPDISILSDEFLAEVREMGKRNLAIEALKKLINGEVRSQAKRNVTQSKEFTERLEAAIARYHTNALTTAQVLEELIQIAKDIRVDLSRIYAALDAHLGCLAFESQGAFASQR
jgi:type I restriction enzyme R subunit